MSEHFMFAGRCTRMQFWIVQLYVALTMALFFVLGVTLDTYFGGNLFANLYVGVGVLIIILEWSTFIRRYRDTGISRGWYYFLLIPYLGALLPIVIIFLPSKKD